jgi:predicted transposase/invertase (TIGR01784 family)
MQNGYTKREKIEVKMEFLRMLLRLELDPARLTLLTGFFDTYLRLNEAEEQKVIEEVKAMSAKEGEKVMEIINSYERKGREKGKQEGKQEGIQEGMQLGRKEAMIMVAKRMKEKGKSIEEIADLTGLGIEAIKRI